MEIHSRRGGESMQWFSIMYQHNFGQRRWSAGNVLQEFEAWGLPTWDSDPMLPMPPLSQRGRALAGDSLPVYQLPPPMFQSPPPSPDLRRCPTSSRIWGSYWTHLVSSLSFSSHLESWLTFWPRSSSLRGEMSTSARSTKNT